MNAFLLGCTLCVCIGPEDPRPVPSDRVGEFIAQLEEPIGKDQELKMVRLCGLGSSIGRRQVEAIGQLVRLSEAAKPAVLALVGDKTKPCRARAYGAIVLVDWLRGTGAKQVLATDVLDALKAALDPREEFALKWAVLDWSHRYGAAAIREKYRSIPKGVINVDPETLCFSDEAMDRMLPAIIALLGDTEPEIAAKAANTVWAFGRPKRGTAELVALLEHSDLKVKAAAARALGVVGAGNADVLHALVGQVDRKQPVEHLGAVVAALREFGPQAKATVPELVAILNDPRAREIDCTVLFCLGAIGADAKTAAPAILAYIADPKTDAVAMDIGVVALRKIDPAAATKGAEIMRRKAEDFRRTNPPSPSKSLGPPVK